MNPAVNDSQTVIVGGTDTRTYFFNVNAGTLIRKVEGGAVCRFGNDNNTVAMVHKGKLMLYDFLNDRILEEYAFEKGWGMVDPNFCWYGDDEIYLQIEKELYPSCK